MSRIEGRGLLGGLFVVGGLLLLLQNLDVLFAPWDLVWSVILLASGLAFLGYFLEKPDQWWAPIPALAFIAIGALIFLNTTAPRISGAWGGSIVLGDLGLGFWLAYLVRRRHWWAIIPGGVLVTLAIVAGLPKTLTGHVAGAVFFIGLGITFGLVYLLARTPRPMNWALVPALLLTLIGVFVLVSGSPLLGLLWPLLLILLGGYLVLRAVWPAKA